MSLCPVAGPGRTTFSSRRALLLAVAVLLTAITAPHVAVAQVPVGLAPSDTVWEVRLTDGSVLLARVEAADAQRLVLRTEGGARVELERAQVRDVRPAAGRFVDGQYWRDDPNTTRLFFAPTGRSLARGEGYFGVYELFIPFLSYGLTDEITISGGSPFYLGMFDTAPPFYLAPKLRIVAAPRTQVSVGVLSVFLPRSWTWDGDRSHTAGIVYGVGTFGDADEAVTAGIGWGYADGDFASRPVVMLGGEKRVGRMTKLVTENWTVPGADGAVLSGGVRFFGERISADAGLAGFVGGGASGCCLPLVNFVYSFGRGS
jgi:hypothetical protein